MQHDSPAEVAVVGGGVVGVACARSLQRAGLKVMLLDPEGPGTACSYGNAGNIAIDHVLPLARPDILRQVPSMMLDPLGPLHLRRSGLVALLPWLARFVLAARPGRVRQGARALADLLRKATAAWEVELRASGLEHLFRRHGALVIFERGATMGAAVHEERALDAHGVRYRRVEVDEIRHLLPSLTASIAGGRLHLDGAHVTDPYRLVCGMAERLVADGGRLERARVRELVIEDGEIRALRTESGELQVGQVVLATGAEAMSLLRQSGLGVPLVRERGYHVMIDKGAIEASLPVTFAERGFVVTPMDEGIRLAGTVELGCAAQGPDWRRAEMLLRHVRGLFGRSAFDERSRWYGDRPTLPDYLPIIGRAPRMRNLFLALGHQHLGLTLAAITGRLIAELVQGRDPGIDLSAFRPERFSRHL